jgi:hypothetical protein
MDLRAPRAAVDIALLFSAAGGAEGALIAPAGGEGSSAAIAGALDASVANCAGGGSIGASSKLGDGTATVDSDGAAADSSDGAVGTATSRPLCTVRSPGAADGRCAQ